MDLKPSGNSIRAAVHSAPKLSVWSYDPHILQCQKKSNSSVDCITITECEYRGRHLPTVRNRLLIISPNTFCTQTHSLTKEIMKLLDNLELETLTVQLSRASRRYALDVKLESYSCKMVSKEKRQLKELLARLEVEDLKDSCLRLSSSRTLRGFRELTGEALDRGTFTMSTSQAEFDVNLQTPNRSRTTSCCSDGDAIDSETKLSHPFISVKEFFCLMSTITLSFNSTYDFMNAASDDFCLEPELAVVKNYISRLCSIYVDKYEVLAPKLWNAIEEEILPHKCVIYSYKPNHSTDPYSFRCLASFNYFFVNRTLRRILFFSLCVQNEPPIDDLCDDDMEDIF